MSDIGFANLLVIYERMKIIDYLEPYTTDKVCFLVPKPPLSPKWMDIITIFEKEVWFSIIITLTVSFIFTYFYGILYPNAENKHIVLLELFGLFFDESLPITSKLR